ncbi:CoA transferase [Sphingomonas tabacisoli]|uniref:CoA transferase n=1 Tax=Sphingomonas tabacisoli TaxID=2249466 RepID=A0ABW4I7S8_9SPHN
MRALEDVLRERIALLPALQEALTPALLLQRDAPGGLRAPGRISANGHCRLVATADGWAALNLARPDDVELVPALTNGRASDWQGIAEAASSMNCSEFVQRAVELQLPVAALGEAMSFVLAEGKSAVPGRVVDLSALWAGPLCAGLLARAGADVVRIESAGRPDPTPLASPQLDRFLNGSKSRITLDLTVAECRARLRDEILAADVIVTSGRSAGLSRIGLDRDELERARPDLIWAAITAYGWEIDRVGFGDDCAVAGGLVKPGEPPSFMGDALADPLTGLESALAVCERVARGAGGLLDLPMAGVAAAYRRRIAS